MCGYVCGCITVQIFYGREFIDYILPMFTCISFNLEEIIDDSWGLRVRFVGVPVVTHT